MSPGLSGEPRLTSQIIVDEHRQRKTSKVFQPLTFSCDSGGIQTHNLLIRSQMLYSVELRNQSFAFISELRVQRYYVSAKPPNFSATFSSKTA